MRLPEEIICFLRTPAVGGGGGGEELDFVRKKTDADVSEYTQSF